MFSRVFLVALALALTASAVPTNGPPKGGNCNVGELHCCDSNISHSGNTNANSAGLLSGLLVGVTPMIPVTCVPVSVLGLGTINCNAQTVCCDRNNFNGLNVLTCSPVNVAL